MDRKDVYAVINEERNYQDEKWGSTFSGDRPGDGSRSVDEFVLYMQSYMQRAVDMAGRSADKSDTLDLLRKVVALGIHCFEQHGVPPREGLEARPKQEAVVINATDAEMRAALAVVQHSLLSSGGLVRWTFHWDPDGRSAISWWKRSVNWCVKHLLGGKEPFEDPLNFGKWERIVANQVAPHEDILRFVMLTKSALSELESRKRQEVIQ